MPAPAILDEGDADAIRRHIHPALTAGLLPDDVVMGPAGAGLAEREAKRLDPDWANTLAGDDGDALRAATMMLAAAWLAPAGLAALPKQVALGDFRFSVDIPDPEKVRADLRGRAGDLIAAWSSGPEQAAVTRKPWGMSVPAGRRGRMAL